MTTRTTETKVTFRRKEREYYILSRRKEMVTADAFLGYEIGTKLNLMASHLLASLQSSIVVTERLMSQR